jgi:hypothetical protein
MTTTHDTDDGRHLPVLFRSRHDPVPAWSPPPRVAQPRLDVIPVGDGVLSTYTGPEARVLREMATPAADRAPHPFAAEPPRPAVTREPSRRIGWALVIAALAQTVVAAVAIATTSYVVGFVAVVCMAICGMVLVIAESIGRGAGR